MKEEVSERLAKRETGRWGTCESDLKRRMIKSKDGNTRRQRRVGSLSNLSLHPPFDVALLLLVNTFSAWRDVLSSLISKPSPAISLYYALHAHRCWFDLEITRVHGFRRSVWSSNISPSWILNRLKLSAHWNRFQPMFTHLVIGIWSELLSGQPLELQEDLMQ